MGDGVGEYQAELMRQWIDNEAEFSERKLRMLIGRGINLPGGAVRRKGGWV